MSDQALKCGLNDGFARAWADVARSDTLRALVTDAYVLLKTADGCTPDRRIELLSDLCAAWKEYDREVVRRNSVLTRTEKLVQLAMLAKDLGFDPWVSDPGRFWLLKPGLPADEAAAIREVLGQGVKP